MPYVAGFAPWSMFGAAPGWQRWAPAPLVALGMVVHRMAPSDSQDAPCLENGAVAALSAVAAHACRIKDSALEFRTGLAAQGRSAPTARDTLAVHRPSVLDAVRGFGLDWFRDPAFPTKRAPAWRPRGMRSHAVSGWNR